MGNELDHCRAFQLGEAFAEFKQGCRASILYSEVIHFEIEEVLAGKCFCFARDNGMSVYSRKIIGTNRVRVIVCPQLSELKRDDLEEVTTEIFQAHCNRMKHSAAKAAAQAAQQIEDRR